MDAMQTLVRDRWMMVVRGALACVFIALGWPLRVSRDVVAVIVTWAIVTGVLEIVTAARAQRPAAFWLFATAGLTSLSLAVSLLILRHADLDIVARLMGGYAVLFGVTMMLVTARLSRGGRRATRVHGRA